jgi:hypothetical protein
MVTVGGLALLPPSVLHLGWAGVRGCTRLFPARRRHCAARTRNVHGLKVHSVTFTLGNGVSAG